MIAKVLAGSLLVVWLDGAIVLPLFGYLWLVSGWQQAWGLCLLAAAVGYLWHCTIRPRQNCPGGRFKYSELVPGASRNCWLCHGRGRLIRPGALIWPRFRTELARQFRR